jgi:hypothetical protein
MSFIDLQMIIVPVVLIGTLLFYQLSKGYYHD